MSPSILKAMRTLLLLALLALGLYWYAERYGLAVGYPPFLPVFYWKYTGEAQYPIRVSGLYDAVKVKVSGDLEEGRLSEALLRDGRVVGERVYSGSFQEEARFPASPGEYFLRFQLQGAKGRVRYDWVTTKFAP
jgi:membrane-associated protease RseP (regulator of RpoE activity)